MPARRGAGGRPGHDVELGPEDWLRAAAEALAEEGPDALRVERLARRLGVTKGSFYWHFANRRALLDALVAAWKRVGTTRIVDAVEEAGGAPRDRLWRLYRRTSTDEGLPVELALRDLGLRDPAVAAAVRAVDAARLRYVRGLFRALGWPRVEAEGRAMALYSLLVGNHFIAPAHAGLGRRRVLDAAVEALLRPP